MLVISSLIINNGMIYENSPNDYMRNMSLNHEFLEKYRNSDIVLCCGLGRWEGSA